MTKRWSAWDRRDQLLRRCLSIFKSVNHAIDFAAAQIHNGSTQAELIGDVDNRRRQRGRLISDIERELKRSHAG